MHRRCRFLLKLSFILWTLLILAGCSSSSTPRDPYAATIAEGRTAVEEAMAETGARAVSVALVDGDHVIWSEAFGAATTNSL